MQRMGVQGPGNRFPSTFQGVSSQDMYPFTICGQGPPLEEEGTLSLSPQNVEKRDMWIPISHAVDEDLQWCMLGHNVLMGARVIPKDPDA